MIYSLKYELLDCLIEKFLVQYQVERQESIKDPSERLQIVINYINMNYQHLLSLNTLAEKLYLSPSCLLYTSTTATNSPCSTEKVTPSRARVIFGSVP